MLGKRAARGRCCTSCSNLDDVCMYVLSSLLPEGITRQVYLDQLQSSSYHLRSLTRNLSYHHSNHGRQALHQRDSFGGQGELPSVDIMR